MDIRRIEPNEIDAVLEVFANNFFGDRYYKGWYKDKKEMMDDFREVMEWTLENGWNMGAYEEGSLVGMALTFPLGKLDDHMFGEFFGTEGELHDLMKRHLDSTYIFAVCVNEENRCKGIATELFGSILEEGTSYISDTTSEIGQHMFGKRGFSLERMNTTDDFWHKAYRPALTGKETVA